MTLRSNYDDIHLEIYLPAYILLIKKYQNLQ